MEHYLVFLIIIIFFTSLTILFFGFSITCGLFCFDYRTTSFVHYFLPSFFTTAFLPLTISICFFLSQGSIETTSLPSQCRVRLRTNHPSQNSLMGIPLVCWCFPNLFIYLISYTEYVVVLVESSSICQFIQFGNALQHFYPSFYLYLFWCFCLILFYFILSFCSLLIWLIWLSFFIPFIFSLILLKLQWLLALYF